MNPIAEIELLNALDTPLTISIGVGSWFLGKHTSISVSIGKGYNTIYGDNSNSYFEITSRSDEVTDNGNLVAMVQGLFCCMVYSADGLKTPKTLQGNFNGKFKVD